MINIVKRKIVNYLLDINKPKDIDLFNTQKIIINITDNSIEEVLRKLSALPKESKILNSRITINGELLLWISSIEEYTFWNTLSRNKNGTYSLK